MINILEIPEFYFSLLTLLNLFNFIDRGIIPGSTDEFTNFIEDNIETGHPSLYIGLLQSAFIVGFCLASPIFAGLVHYYGPFHLVTAGVTVWTCAVLLSGFAYYADSYMMLLFGRVLSGVGESSFQCCIPPWIATNSDENSKSRWLAIFNTAIPVGTALGYVYSSLISTSIGWQWAFFLEAVLIFPFLVFVFLICPRFPHLKPGVRHFPPVNENDYEEIVPIPPNSEAEAGVKDALKHDEATTSLLSSIEDDNLAQEQGKDVDVKLDPDLDQEEHPPNLYEEVKLICRYPCYLFITAGYTAQTGALIGLSTFGSAFLMGLNYFDSEVESSSLFGVVVSVAGIVGFPLGGMLLDYLSARSKHEQGHSHAELVRATLLMIVTSIGGCILFVLTFWIRSKALFIVVLFFGCLFLFLCNSSITIAILLSVPVENRALAIAFTSIVIHMFGDVPSPLVVGYLKDDLAPGCTGDDDAVSTSEDCRDDAQGLRITMLLVSLWFSWCIAFFTMAFVHAKRDYKAEKARRPSLYMDPVTRKISKQE
mmetsp:Transcript_21017/g.30343  ORF Transcript_21017/g.30343 Transcript_21017/m.30343 type:complete len:537 (-) Transcript_21017:145-1755(-)|eukprot:CAMPEP_0185035178 /NCGR_PEP_ID=MMETSP1103-20130426/26072_1 /TAXON_ID=36769 /ORGANISM="Paraphysomonas bandaiensis, Strain Caron Lab Isolate" /LENGTH=536 /DNA_ID=CAMNT_0027572145 /DNA_START=83 /DNA_END=1693 /DNA_ORIENTATION=+